MGRCGDIGYDSGEACCVIVCEREGGGGGRVRNLRKMIRNRKYGKIHSESCGIKLNFHWNSTFPVDLAPNGIPLRSAPTQFKID